MDRCTFSLDTYYLIERGRTLASFAYMLASVMLSVDALIAALPAMERLSARNTITKDPR